MACTGVVGTGEPLADAGQVTADAGPSGAIDAGVVTLDAGMAFDAGGALDAGAPDAGRSDGCPTAPPFDTLAPELQRCLEPLLLAIGNRSRRIVSFDGQTWLADQIDDGNTVNGQMLDDAATGAAFGKGYIVAGSDFGIFTSADRGQTWVKAPPPAPQQWGQGIHVSPMAFTGRKFVAYSDTATFTSSDAFVWEKHVVTTFNGSHIAFFGNAVGANGRIVASGGGSALNVSDDDGVTWRQIEVGITGGLRSLIYANDTFVGLAKGARLSSKDNGDSWQVAIDDCAANDPVKCVGDGPSELTLRDGGFVFTTSGNAILESNNGVDWAKTGNGYGFDWSHVFFNGVDYAVHGTNSYWHSPSAGGPWPTSDFPSANAAFGVERLVLGRVLKR